MAEALVNVVRLLLFLFHITREGPGIIREDPRIFITLAVLLIAGAIVAVLIRKRRRDEFPTLR
jgi:hypothetical protein